ncbi:MAG: S9 family peptidase [Gammaproteobacteria bacterium]|jgi:dipeptidyl aminopeptidase/acylaminoacyl peptidase
MDEKTTMTEADMQTRKPMPCGSWPSPITADAVVRQGIRLFQPQFGAGRLYWLETRPDEDGRTALVRQGDDGKKEDVLARPFSVRSRVHEYGGGAYRVAEDYIFFVENSDQAVYAVSEGDVPRRLTNESTHRHADLHWDASFRRIVCVCEDHSGDGEPDNMLVAIEPNGRKTVLTRGRDFYSSPRVSADGRRIAWLAWSHPQLPWDGTELWLAPVEDDGSIGTPRQIAGGTGESIMQPEWGPDGRLYFVSDRSNWWNLYAWDRNITIRLTDLQAETGQPQWVFGQSLYGFPDRDRVAFAATRDGRWDAFCGELPGCRPRPLATGLDAIDHLVAADGRIVIVASNSHIAPSLVELTPEGDATFLVRTDNGDVDDAYISDPAPARFPTGDDAEAYGLFYAPVNPDFGPLEGERPPLIIRCHGGPTGATSTALDMRTQFWTSRGFAVLDLNYRGSTGYGREYRRSLYGRWGEADVEDAVAGARYLAGKGLIDGERLLISGGSAGGYTVLCALTFTDAFRAGASYFGIADLERMFETTHKFESRYDHWLIGPYPEARELYRERSPLHHADRISSPVIFFQGARDKVVPPDQSQMMVRALRDNGVPVAYMEFADEAHGFREAGAIRRSLLAEYYFYCRILGLPLPEGAEIEIENLD